MLAFQGRSCYDRQFGKHCAVSDGTSDVFPSGIVRPPAVDTRSDTAAECDSTAHLYAVVFAHLQTSRCHVTCWLRIYNNMKKMKNGLLRIAAQCWIVHETLKP